MKNSFDLHFVVIALLLFCSCQRGVDVNPSQSITDSTVTIDPTLSNYDVKNNTSKVVQADIYHSSDSIKIDVNNDGEFDLKITSFFSNNISGYSNSSSEISTLNTHTSILSEENKDTACTYIIPTTTDTDGNIIFRPRKYYENYDYTKTYNSSLQLIITANYYPTIKSLSDVLNKDNTAWKNGDFTLAYYSNFYPASNLGGGPISSSDTIYSTMVDRGTWVNLNHKFIAVRYISHDAAYLGWLEIGLSGYKIVTVYQYAFKRVLP